MMPDPKIAAQFQWVLQNCTSVLISTHLNPDGDALGSALAMSHYLDQCGKLNEVVVHNNAPYNLLFLPGLDRVKLKATCSHDAGIILDLDAMHRLGDVEPLFADCRDVVVIDHHEPHEEPGTLRIIDPAAPATALILARLFKELQANITPDMATCLLAGVVTDTGSFRYRNTTEEALHVAAELLHCGGDIVQIAEEVYHKRPLAGVRLLGRCLDNMRIEESDQMAWSVLKVADFDETGAAESHTEGLVNELLAINTVKIAAVIRQRSTDKQVRASVRSREGYDVASAVRPFGGGGHRNAAGVTFDCPIDEAERLLVGALKSCLASS